jgi:hypothetical protein
VGPYQGSLEEGMQHFHQFLRENIPLMGLEARAHSTD